jgi:hypothetical protein
VRGLSAGTSNVEGRTSRRTIQTGRSSPSTMGTGPLQTPSRWISTSTGRPSRSRITTSR